MKNSIYSLFEIPINAKIYIYGSGKFGRGLKKKITRCRTDIQILGFIDSYKSGYTEGLPKIQIEALDTSGEGYDLILIASAFYEKIARELDILQIKQYKIFSGNYLLGNFNQYLLSLYELPQGGRVTLRGSEEFCKTLSKLLKEFRRDVIINPVPVTNEDLSRWTYEHKGSEVGWELISESLYEKIPHDTSSIESLKIINDQILTVPKDCKTPILVYQMGKVGSSTVSHSLRPFFEESNLLHTHWLIPKHIKKNASWGFRFGNFQVIQTNSRSFNWFHFLKTLDEIKIITLVRDLISRELSEFFHEITYARPDFFSENGRLKTDIALSSLRDRLSAFKAKDHITTWWFENEFKNSMGFSVFDYPFDKGNGYDLIRFKNKNVLLITLESLEQNFKIIGQFLNIHEPVKMVKSNLQSEKKYSAEYQYILDHFSLPEDVCHYIYDSPYMSHFYTADSIEAFTKKWSFSTKSNQSSEKKEHL